MRVQFLYAASVTCNRFVRAMIELKLKQFKLFTERTKTVATPRTSQQRSNVHERFNNAILTYDNDCLTSASSSLFRMLRCFTSAVSFCSSGTIASVSIDDTRRTAVLLIGSSEEHASCSSTGRRKIK